MYKCVDMDACMCGFVYLKAFMDIQCMYVCMLCYVCMYVCMYESGL